MFHLIITVTYDEYTLRLLSKMHSLPTQENSPLGETNSEQGTLS